MNARSKSLGSSLASAFFAASRKRLYSSASADLLLRAIFQCIPDLVSPRQSWTRNENDSPNPGNQSERISDGLIAIKSVQQRISVDCDRGPEAKRMLRPRQIPERILSHKRWCYGTLNPRMVRGRSRPLVYFRIKRPRNEATDPIDTANPNARFYDFKRWVPLDWRSILICKNGVAAAKGKCAIRPDLQEGRSIAWIAHGNGIGSRNKRYVSYLRTLPQRVLEPYQINAACHLRVVDRKQPRTRNMKTKVER